MEVENLTVQVSIEEEEFHHKQPKVDTVPMLLVKNEAPKQNMKLKKKWLLKSWRFKFKNTAAPRYNKTRNDMLHVALTSSKFLTLKYRTIGKRSRLLSLTDWCECRQHASVVWHQWRAKTSQRGFLRWLTHWNCRRKTFILLVLLYLNKIFPVGVDGDYYQKRAQWIVESCLKKQESQQIKTKRLVLKASSQGTSNLELWRKTFQSRGRWKQHRFLKDWNFKYKRACFWNELQI